MSNFVKKLVHEPLVHFLLLGVVIFVGSSLVSGNSTNQAGKIVVTRGQLASLWDSFVSVRQRQPTSDEWQGLIRDRVREEVYYREAIAMGLDKDDIIIRRRLQQKMEFVSEDVAARVQPTDDELGRFLQAHPDLFRVEQQFTFHQVFLNPQKHGENLARDAAQLLARLNREGGQADISAVGDAILLDHTFDAVPAREIAKQFGDKFVTALGGLPLGQWQGPVESGYGVHLVFISQRLEGRLPMLAEVHDAVLREWENANRQQMNEKFYQDLLRHYTVTIETQEPLEARNAPARK